MCKSGGGAVSRQEALKIANVDFTSESEAQKASFAELDRSKSWSQKLPSVYRSSKNGPLKTQSKNNMTIGKIFKSGWVHTRVEFLERLPENEQNEVFCRQETTFIPGYPIFYPVCTGESKSYMQSTGEQVGQANMFGLGLGILFINTTMVSPAIDTTLQGKTPAQYNAFKGWFLAAGIIGGGRMNHKYYGQILWTAFPVGTAD